jgi:hypothetical protein
MIGLQKKNLFTEKIRTNSLNQRLTNFPKEKFYYLEKAKEEMQYMQLNKAGK